MDGVFEGGGALGAAYVGALSFLHANNVWFTHVAGKSVGSVMAGMIAVGFTAEEIQWLCSAFPDRPPALAAYAGTASPRRLPSAASWICPRWTTLNGSALMPDAVGAFSFTDNSAPNGSAYYRSVQH